MSEFQSGTGPTPTEIEEIRARATAASEGPWRDVCMGSEGWRITNEREGGTILDRKPTIAFVGYGEWEQDKANVAFIVNARSDVPALLAAYDVMKEERDEALRHYADQQVVLSQAFATVERLRKAESWAEVEAALSGREGS